MTRAMTNAERQKAYRERRKKSADRVELRVTVSRETADRLKRLVRHTPSAMALQTGTTAGELLETLLRMQENKVVTHKKSDGLRAYFAGYDVPEQYKHKL